MILRNFFLLLYAALLSASPTIIIDSDNTNITNFELEYFIDDTGKMRFEDVKSQVFSPTLSKVSLGKHKVHNWMRFDITNATDETKTLFIHNQTAYMINAMTFMALQNEKIINRLDIDLDNIDDAKKMVGRDAIFSFELKAGLTKTIYIKTVAEAYQFFDIALYDNENSKHALRANSTFVLLVVGMLAALAIYHFMLYVSSGYKEYIYYTLYLGSALVWELQVTGVLANSVAFYFNDFNNIFLLFVLIIPVFLILFVKTIFDTAAIYKTENLFLNSIILLSIIGIIVGLDDVVSALYFTSYIYMYVFFILFLSIVSIYRKGNPLAKIFLIGNSFFLLFVFISDLFFLGLVPYNDFTFNAANVGILIEAMVLAFILSYRIKLLQKSEIEKIKILAKQTELKNLNETLEKRVDEAVKEIQSKEQLLQQQSRLAQMGEMISMIAHQWRQPLAAVSAATIGIQTKMALKKYDLEKPEEREKFGDFLNHKLLSIQEYITVMTETVDDFRNFFKKQDSAETINVNGVIEKALNIVNASYVAKDIYLVKKMESEKEVALFQNEMMQVILNILKNADDAFGDNAVHKEISIRTYDTDAEVIVEICDNAGGVPSEIVEKIFDPYFSTKTDQNGTGLGLYMSKMIIEDHHNGKLTLQNRDSGTCFTIKLMSANVSDAQKELL